MITVEKTTPIGYWLIVKAEKRREQTSGGILLTQTETNQEKLGFHVGKVLKIGDKVLDFININRDNKITEEELFSRRLILRYYLKDVMKFKISSTDEPIFLLHIADPNVNIIGLCDDENIEMV